jgi:hypothetical protein
VKEPVRPPAELVGPAEQGKLVLLGKILVVAFLPIVCLARALSAVRLATRGDGCLGYGVLTAGVALLPMGVCFPIAVLLGPANLEVTVFLYFASLCFSVLILNSSLTCVVELSDRAAVLAIPAALVVSIWLSKVIISAVVWN